MSKEIHELAIKLKELVCVDNHNDCDYCPLHDSIKNNCGFDYLMVD